MFVSKIISNASVGHGSGLYFTDRVAVSVENGFHGLKMKVVQMQSNAEKNKAELRALFQRVVTKSLAGDRDCILGRAGTQDEN